jgi:hydrogenase maturation protease
MASALVLGIGNTLLSDDGAGVHAALQLADRTAEHSGVRVLDAGTLGFALLPEIQRCGALLVFDATRSGEAPGSVTVREASEMDAFVRRSGRSVHEVGLADLLDMARLTDGLPSRRALIGIEVQTIDWGVTCSSLVRAALPRAVDAAMNILGQWRALTATADIADVA